MTWQLAFFRNLNLGQRGSPTRDQVLTAIAVAGAREAVSFQVNGTVLFRAPAPVRTVSAVRTQLARVSGWDDIAPVRDATWLRRVVADAADAGEHAEVAFFDLRRDFPEPLPWRPATGRVTVLRADRRHALAANDLPRTSYATPVLERLLGVRVTSRGLSTLERLVARHLDPGGVRAGY